jgi:hypothetical protein
LINLVFNTVWLKIQIVDILVIRRLQKWTELGKLPYCRSAWGCVLMHGSTVGSVTSMAVNYRRRCWKMRHECHLSL